jgi:hypothetical protein
MAFDKLRRLMGSRVEGASAALEADGSAVGPDDDATSSRVTVRGWDPKTKEQIVGSAGASGREASGAATVGGSVEPPVDEPSGIAIGDPGVNGNLTGGPVDEPAGIAIGDPGVNGNLTDDPGGGGATPDLAASGPIRLDPTPARLSTNLSTERQTPSRDFGDRAMTDDTDAPEDPAVAATGPVRLDPTPARLSTNMTIERQTPKRDFGDRMRTGDSDTPDDAASDAHADVTGGAVPDTEFKAGADLAGRKAMDWDADDDGPSTLLDMSGASDADGVMTAADLDTDGLADAADIDIDTDGDAVGADDLMVDG